MLAWADGDSINQRREGRRKTRFEAEDNKFSTKHMTTKSLHSSRNAQYDGYMDLQFSREI